GVIREAPGGPRHKVENRVERDSKVRLGGVSVGERLRDSYGLPARLVLEEMPDPPAARTGEQAEVPIASSALQKPAHSVWISTLPPLLLRHARAPEPERVSSRALGAWMPESQKYRNGPNVPRSGFFEDDAPLSRARGQPASSRGQGAWSAEV